MEENGPEHHPQTPSHTPHDSATSVGSSREEDVERIKDLEDEVKILAEKANAATQKYADYENEIRVLEAKLRQESRKNSVPIIDSSLGTAGAAPRPGISRFGSFMGTRKTSGGSQDGAIHPSATREKELEEQLVKEQTLRIAAEAKVKEVSEEIEDLSATLFQQANDMVATERRQNFELRERLHALEEQQQQQREIVGDDTLRKENARLKEKLSSLEQRAADRGKRLERLEAANKRIERIRAMLHPP